MPARALILPILLAFVTSCEKPDSVELGAACTGSAQCKDPADTCLTVNGKSTCSMACTKDKRCPDGFACPVTDQSKMEQGMCWPAAEVARNAAKVY